MVCSVCGFSGHNKRTCAKNAAKRIAHAVAKYGASAVLARGLDAFCPGLGLTYEAFNLAMLLIQTVRTKGATEEAFVEVFMTMLQD